MPLGDPHDNTPPSTRPALGDVIQALVASTENINIGAFVPGQDEIDETGVLEGDRVLLKNQSSAAQNGVYLANAEALERAPEADTADDFTRGLVVEIEQGTHAGQRWGCAGGVVNVGVTALTFERVQAVAISLGS